MYFERLPALILGTVLLFLAPGSACPGESKPASAEYIKVEVKGKVQAAPFDPNQARGIDPDHQRFGLPLAFVEVKGQKLWLDFGENRAARKELDRFWGEKSFSGYFPPFPAVIRGRLEFGNVPGPLPQAPGVRANIQGAAIVVESMRHEPVK